MTEMTTRKLMQAPAHPLFSNRDLRDLIVPLVFEQGLAMMVGMVDTMMISSAGEAAVSGVSLVDMINMLIFAVLAAMATGGCVVVSQYLGARKPEEARKSAAQLLLTVLVLGLLIMLLVFLLYRQLLRLLFGSIEEDVMQNAIIYFLIGAVSYPFLGLYNACAALFRAMGNSRITLEASLAVNAINVVGNAIGIYVLHLGVAGVAIPSLISRAAGAAILYVLLRRRKEGRDIWLERGLPRPDLSVIRRILHIGIPNGLENGIFQLGRVLVVSIISMFGTIEIAANGVANGLDALGIVGGQATSLAMITVIGQCVGAGDEEQVRYYMKKIIVITYGLFLLIDLPVLIFLKPLLSLYGLQAETTALAWKLVMIHAGSALFLWPIGFVFPNMLRACNDVRYTMVVSIASMFIFRLGFSYIIGVGMGWGAVGVWTAMVMDWICRCICFILRYRSGRWRKLAGLQDKLQS